MNPKKPLYGKGNCQAREKHSQDVELKTLPVYTSDRKLVSKLTNQLGKKNLNIKNPNNPV